MALMLSYDLKRNCLVKEKGRALGPYILEHDEKGYKNELANQSLEIPDRNIKIDVKTNFHYGSASYLRATITQNDKIIFNFIDTIFLRSICRVESDPVDWSSFFDEIITLYTSIYNSESYINKYFDEINAVISTASDCNDNKMMLVTSRLAEIIEKMPESVFADNILLSTRIKESCILLLQSIILEGKDSQWIKKYQQVVEKNLHVIVCHLSERNELLNVLEEIRIKNDSNDC